MAVTRLTPEQLQTLREFEDSFRQTCLIEGSDPESLESFRTYVFTCLSIITHSIKDRGGFE